MKERYTILEFLLLSKMYSPKQAVEIDKHILLEHKFQYADEWLNSEHFSESPMRTIKALKMAKKLGIKCKLNSGQITADAIAKATPTRIQQQIFMHTERLAYWKKIAKVKGIKIESLEGMQ